MNENITVEIIEYLLSIFPQVDRLRTDKFCPDDETEAYPLHVCCCNQYCPSSVIKLLIGKYPDALSHYCLVHEGIGDMFNQDEDKNVTGLPLHYYLDRASNVNAVTVKMLVDAYPEELLATNNVAPIHVAISNSQINDLHEVITFLLKSEPNSIRSRDNLSATLLNTACGNKGMNFELFQLMYDAWPEAFRLRDNHRWLPIHYLCRNRDLDEINSLNILRFMLNIDPTLPRELADNGGWLPIHIAAASKSTTFCKLLIDAYPESIKVEEADHKLPIHEACSGNKDDTADTIQCMLELDPELINAEGSGGKLPIHWAAEKGRTKSIEILLKFDPDAASKETNNGSRRLPLHRACSTYNPNLSSIQVLYDAYPDAIFARDGDGRTPLDIARRYNGSLDFLQFQLRYAQKARDTTFMTTADENGLLPLHLALKVMLRNNISLGSIKLWVKGNPAAVQVADQNGIYPLHIACEFTSARVVQFLVECDEDIVERSDANEDSPLHYACRAGNLGVIKYLLEVNVPSVSERNYNNKLPLHLLFECRGETLDRDCLGYVETVQQLLLANPEVVRDLFPH